MIKYTHTLAIACLISFSLSHSSYPTTFSASIPNEAFRVMTKKFLKSAASGNIKTLQEMLDNGVDVDATDSSGKTAIQLAVLNQHIEVVKILLKHDANIFLHRNDDNETTLDIAAKHGNVAIAKLLLEQIKNRQKIQWYFSSALAIAAAHGHLEMVKLLLQYGININARNHRLNYGRKESALHMAVENGHDTVVKYLIEHGASLEEDLLRCAAEHGHTSIVKILLDNEMDVRNQDHHHRCPLKLAAKNGHLATVKFLLVNGACLYAPIETVLDDLASNLEDIDDELASFILEYIKKPFNNNITDSRGNTALHSFARYRVPKTLEALVKSGASPNCPNKEGITPLHIATYNNNHIGFSILLKNGANINQQTKDGTTALHIAAQQKNIKTIQNILEHKPNVIIGNKDGYTPLHSAVERGNLKIVELLCKNGAQLNTRTNQGDTPLHLAANRNDEKMVDLLLNHGADPSIGTSFLIWKSKKAADLTSNPNLQEKLGGKTNLTNFIITSSIVTAIVGIITTSYLWKALKKAKTKKCLHNNEEQLQAKIINAIQAPIAPISPNNLR